MNPEAQNRYPGLEPFSTAQEALFFGRKGDVERLFELVDLHSQVLLYAKSGLGKSSLINAGLIPRLRAARKGERIANQILSIRIGAWVNAQSPSPLEVVHSALAVAGTSYLDKIISQEGSLWWHFKTDAASYSIPPTYYLLFDQFEEIFSHPEASIVGFKRQLADLLYRAVPQHFRSFLEIKQGEEPELLTPAELSHLYQPLRIKVLYAIREDRYSELNRLADVLPDIFQNRFQLAPLTRKRAEEAIVNPAALLGDFQGPPFAYDHDALKQILDYLSGGQRQDVETTQLQVLCSHIERLGKTLVKAGDIPAFDDIFLQFYLDSIAALEPEDRLAVREFIEGYMIIERQRIAYHRLACLEQIPERALDLLLRERHLLRTELSSTGGISYELSHDTLVGPILIAKAAREAEEAVLAAEEAMVAAERERVQEEQRLRAELEREQAARAKARRQLRNTRMALLGTVLAIVLAAAGIMYGLMKKAQAKDARIRSEKADEKFDFLFDQRQETFDKIGMDAPWIGLAIKDSFGVKKIGYVNKGSNFFIEFGLEEAMPFSRFNGFARVKKLDCNSSLYDCLLDSTGMTYRLAFDLNNLSDSVEALDLTECNPYSLPSQFPAHSKVEILLLNGLRLDSLPKGIDQWGKLKILRIADNRLTSLPAEIDNLTALTLLDLHDNCLSSLPPEIGSLSALTELNLNRNKLSSLPPEVGNLRTLRSLSVGGNNLSTLPPEIGKLTRLRSLDIGGNNLSTLPPEIGKLKALTNVRMLPTKLKSIPKEIGNLDSLTSLFLGGDPLTFLPPEIGMLTTLIKLHISWSQLRMLPPEIGNLTALTSLNLDGNKLTSLPPEIGRLTSLTSLVLTGNELTSLPPEIGNLTALTSLTLDGNKLTSVPLEIGKLRALTSLSIRKMNLTHIPPEIRFLKELKVLFVGQNPCANSREKIEGIGKWLAEWLPNCTVTS